MVFNLGYVKKKIESTTKNAGESLAIFIAMRVRRYDAGRIAQWRTSGASLEATGSRTY
jgi:hypothetical protein